jgi:chromosome segregation ATPase
MPDEVIWLTYDGLAERLGIEKESARQRARRGLWARRKDNLGRITVAVPADLLESQTEALRDTPTEALQDPLPDALHEAVENRYLNRYVEKIEQALEVAQERAEALERERDEARDEAVAAEKARAAVAAQLDALNAVLAVERERVTDERRRADERVAVEQQRVEEWKAVADRFAAQAEALAARPTGLFAFFRRRA